MLAPTSPPMAAPAAKNGLSVGVDAVVVEPQDDAGEVGVVGLGAAELIVGVDVGAGRGRAALEILQLRRGGPGRP